MSPTKVPMSSAPKVLSRDGMAGSPASGLAALLELDGAAGEFMAGKERLLGSQRTMVGGTSAGISRVEAYNPPVPRTMDTVMGSYQGLPFLCRNISDEWQYADRRRSPSDRRHGWRQNSASVLGDGFPGLARKRTSWASAESL